MSAPSRPYFVVSMLRRMVPLLVSTACVQAAIQDGPLKMEVITAYNFVVDSNVETPASYSPSAAHLGVKIQNTGVAHGKIRASAPVQDQPRGCSRGNMST
jgi:hypothetical protein